MTDEGFYEMYVQPDSGPCTVHERGFHGEVAWKNRNEAIETAKQKKRVNPHMDFIVHHVVHNSSREVAYRTKDEPA